MSTPSVDRYTFTPTPQRCWDLAEEGAVRLQPEAKARALEHAAICCAQSFNWLNQGADRWLTIRRLMTGACKPDDFGVLMAAVAEGYGPKVRIVAEQLAGAR